MAAPAGLVRERMVSARQAGSWTSDPPNARTRAHAARPCPEMAAGIGEEGKIGRQTNYDDGCCLPRPAGRARGPSRPPSRSRALKPLCILPPRTVERLGAAQRLALQAVVTAGGGSPAGGIAQLDVQLLFLLVIAR